MPAKRPKKPRERKTPLTERQRRSAWWLFAVRRFRGKTQDEMFRSFSYSTASPLSDLERGESVATLEHLETAARVYNVPLSLFIQPPATDLDRLAQLAAGHTIDPDDVLIPLSVLRRLGREALESVAAGDLSALQAESPATAEPLPQPNGGAAA